MLSGSKAVKSFLSFLIFISMNASAELEYGVGAAVRSYPLSGGAMGDVGYGYRVWGDEGGDSPWYGYVKPNLRFSTAGTYNALEGKLSVFPISILGLSAAYEMIDNGANYQAYDCKKYDCKGRFTRQSVEATLALGYAEWFGIVFYGMDKWDQGGGTKNFIVPTYGLAGLHGGDEIKYLIIAGGYKWDEEWTLMAAVTSATMQDLTGEMQMILGLATYKWDEQWKFTAGAGVFDSDVKASGATMILRGTWSPTPSVELF